MTVILLRKGDKFMTENISLQLYEMMQLIRQFEQSVHDSSQKKLFHGTTHLYIGQEAVATGVCAHLRDEDYITSTHRSHGHALAKGLCPKKVMAEIFGKESGYSKGKGGSMHLADISKGHIGSNGVVAANIPIAVGAAFSIKQQKKDNIVVCFFGDGAVNEGAFHEAMNLASIWKLPIIFVCENNGYGMSTKISDVTNVSHLSELAQNYRMKNQVVDGQNLEAVYEISGKIIDEVRQRKEPYFLEAKTYRYVGHSRSDKQLYRTEREVEKWQRHDPIDQLYKILIDKGQTPEKIKAVEKKVEKIVDEAFQFAIESKSQSLSELETDVYLERNMM